MKLKHYLCNLIICVGLVPILTACSVAPEASSFETSSLQPVTSSIYSEPVNSKTSSTVLSIAVSSPASSVSSASAPSQKPTSSASVSSIKQSIQQHDKSSAYIAIMKKLDADVGLNGNIKYISVDLTRAVVTDNEKNQILKYTESYGYEVLNNTLTELADKGLVVNYNFINGICFMFQDISENSDGTLEIKGTKYRGNTGAYGASYTMSYNNSTSSWEISKTSGKWIS